MLLYHIDRKNSLKIGQIISLISLSEISFFTEKLNANDLNFCDGLSHHGKKYLCGAFGVYDERSAQIELIYELVRRAYFPDKISRLQAMFCCSSVDELEKNWSAIGMSTPYSQVVTFDVEEENYSKHDASLLFFDTSHFTGSAFTPGKRYYSNLVVLEYAFRYWRGDMSNKPTIEYLVRPPITVLNSQPYHQTES